MRHLTRIKERGFALIATILVVSVTMALAGGVATLVVNEVKSLEGFTQSQKAEELAFLGYEKAMVDLQSDSNWTNNGGTTTSTYLGGSVSVILQDAATHSITVVSTGTINDQQYELKKTLVRSVTMARDVSIDTGSAFYTDSVTYLKQIYLSNTATTSATITHALVNWDPSVSSDEIERVVIDSVDKWKHNGVGSPDGRQQAGTYLTFDTGAVLNGGASQVPLDILFDQNMSGKTIFIILYFSDGSSRTASFAPDTTIANNLNVDVADARIGGGGDREMQRVYLTNLSDSTSMTISQIQVSWIYNDAPARMMERIKFDGSTVWSGSESSGTTVTLSGSNSLGAGDTDQLKIKFDDDMDYYQISMKFIFSADGSSKNAVADFRIDQSAFLEVDTSLAEVNGTRLEGLTLRNTHSEARIWVDSMQLYVTPNLNQSVDVIRIDGTEIFSESDSPDGLSVSLNVDLTEISTSALSHDIDFSSLTDPSDFIITYGMRDETEVSTEISFVPGDGSEVLNSFAGNTSNVMVKTDLKKIEDFYVSKNGEMDVIVEQMKVSWVPDGGILIKKIKFDGTTVFQNNGGTASGTTVNLTSPQTLGTSDTEVKLEFKSTSVVNKDITYTFVLDDSSTQGNSSDTVVKTFRANLNPANGSNWAGGENFEAGEVTNGGAGFTGSWSFTDSLGNSIRDGNKSFSGDWHMRLRRGNNGERQVTSSAQVTTLTMRYRARIKKYDTNGDTSTLQVRVNNGAWTTLRTFSRSTMGNDVYEAFADTLNLTLGQSFDIRFDGDANKNDEELFIDEIYFER